MFKQMIKVKKKQQKKIAESKLSITSQIFWEYEIIRDSKLVKGDQKQKDSLENSYTLFQSHTVQ